MSCRPLLPAPVFLAVSSIARTRQGRNKAAAGSPDGRSRQGAGGRRSTAPGRKKRGGAHRAFPYAAPLPPALFPRACTLRAFFLFRLPQASLPDALFCPGPPRTQGAPCSPYPPAPPSPCSLYPLPPILLLPYPLLPLSPCSSIPGPSIPCSLYPLLPLSPCSLYPPAPYPLPHPLSSRSSPALRLPPDALPSPRHSAASPFSRLICGTKRACFSPFLEHLPGKFPNIRPFPAVSLHFPQSYPPAPPHFFQNPFLFSHLSKILIIFIIFSPIPIEFRYVFSTFIKNKTACMRSLQPV